MILDRFTSTIFLSCPLFISRFVENSWDCWLIYPALFKWLKLFLKKLWECLPPWTRISNLEISSEDSSHFIISHPVSNFSKFSLRLLDWFLHLLPLKTIHPLPYWWTDFAVRYQKSRDWHLIGNFVAEKSWLKVGHFGSQFAVYQLWNLCFINEYIYYFTDII